MSRSGHQVSQNVDNFIRDKPSTRLHAPPGGGSSVGSLIYGGGTGESQFAGYERRNSGRALHKDEVPEQTNPYSKQPPMQSHQQSYGQHHQQQYGQHHQQQYGQPPIQQQQQPLAAAGSRQGSSNAYATGSNQNAGNVLTDRRITRIHAPPGGASSFRLG